ncbi:MAG: hypothetical protein NW208_15945 [Bryobacter sp.]|nr:hypothetical protein [Bryobacter sp.]
MEELPHRSALFDRIPKVPAIGALLPLIAVLAWVFLLTLEDSRDKLRHGADPLSPEVWASPVLLLVMILPLLGCFLLMWNHKRPRPLEWSDVAIAEPLAQPRGNFRLHYAPKAAKAARAGAFAAALCGCIPLVGVWEGDFVAALVALALFGLAYHFWRRAKFYRSAEIQLDGGSFTSPPPKANNALHWAK